MLFSVIEVCHNRIHLCNDYSHITSKYDISLVCETQGNRHHEHKNIIWDQYTLFRQRSSSGHGLTVCTDVLLISYHACTDKHY